MCCSQNIFGTRAVTRVFEVVAVLLGCEGVESLATQIPLLIDDPCGAAISIFLSLLQHPTSFAERSRGGTAPALLRESYAQLSPIKIRSILDLLEQPLAPIVPRVPALAKGSGCLLADLTPQWLDPPHPRLTDAKPIHGVPSSHRASQAANTFRRNFFESTFMSHILSDRELIYPFQGAIGDLP